MSVTTFQHSEKIASKIMELPFIASLSEQDQDQLQRQLAQFRIQAIKDIEAIHQRSWASVKEQSENYLH